MKKLVLIILMGIPMGLFAQERPKGFASELMINAISRECLTIGIKQSSPRKKERIVTVRFMYDLPLGKIGIHMGNF